MFLLIIIKNLLLDIPEKHLKRTVHRQKQASYNWKLNTS